MILKRYVGYSSGKRWCNVILTLSLVMDGVLLVISMNSSSELFSVAFWTCPSLCIIFVLGLNNYSSGILEIIFKNPLTIFIGNISFEIFLIHQLVIKYASIIFTKIHMENHLSLYISAILLSVFFSVCYRKLSDMSIIFKGERISDNAE